MGLPLYREPPAAPRETDRDRDLTAAARSHIRRRVHSRRVRASDALHRAGLDRDRRSSQQVLLDLLQFTQDNSSSSASVNSASSTAATVASSTSSVSGSTSTPQGLEPGSRNHPYSFFRRDFPMQLPRPSFEIYRDEPTPLGYGATQGQPYMLTSFAPNNVRVIRHSPAIEPSLLPERDREHERDSNQVDREAERASSIAEESDSMNRNLGTQLSFDVYSSRMGSLYGRDEEEQPSYVRESSRRFHRIPELMGGTRERMRDLVSATPTIPEAIGTGGSRRRGENMIDGLGDRERSLSPDDDVIWGFESSTGVPRSLDPLDLGTHCEFMSDGESEGEEEEEEGQPEMLVGPGRLFDIVLMETLRRERRRLQPSSIREELDV